METGKASGVEHGGVYAIGRGVTIHPTTTNCVILGVTPIIELGEIARRLGVKPVPVPVDGKILLCSREEPGQVRPDNPHYDFLELVTALLDRMDANAA